jgi:hypothetical protein
MTNKRMGAEPAKTSRARVPQPRRYTRIVPPDATDPYAKTLTGTLKDAFDIIFAVFIIFGIPAIGCYIAGLGW